GMTADLEKRLKEHASGYTKSTKAYIPWELIFIKEALDRLEARRLEKYDKSGVGKEYVKALNLSNRPVVQRIPACRQAGNRCCEDVFRICNMMWYRSPYRCRYDGRFGETAERTC